MKHLVHGDMVANILDTYARATPEQVEAGRRWYPTANGIVTVIANQTGIDPMRVAYAMAALSPRNPWRWNVFDAYSFAAARAEGRTMPSATTYKRNRARAWEALARTGSPWTTSAPKVNAFVAAILGADDAVVVDVWAYRVATTKSAGRITDRAYEAVERAYLEAAQAIGDTPRNVQAVTWLVAQTEGLASHRVNRHDLSFKAGTPNWLKEAIA